MFVGQRIKWKNHENFGCYISCDQKLAVDQLEEIKVENIGRITCRAHHLCIPLSAPSWDN